MRTVGIMSMHRIFNYGSFLQGYGLKSLINSVDATSDIRFLDYKPGPTLVPSAEAPAGGLWRATQKIAEYWKVNASIGDRIRFFNHKRTYARRNFPMLGLTPTPNYDYAVDLQVIGSDEVFNCVQANTNVGYSRDLFGHGSAARRVISYAGSFGNTTIEKLDRYGIREQVARDLEGFAEISVRDENSRAVVRELTGRDPIVNVDPVLAYDYMGDCTSIPVSRMIEVPYMIAYGYSGRFSAAENSAIRAYAKAKKLEVICIGGVQACCDRFVDCSPFEVLALFRDAEAVVTDTFHGSIFSVINERPFLTLIRRSIGDGYGNEEKLGYLLKSLGLSGLGTFEITRDSLEGALGVQPDYEPTRVALRSARKSAREYLARNMAE